jgi:hypothetical protein
LLVIERLSFDISALQNFAARLTAQHSGVAAAAAARAAGKPLGTQQRPQHQHQHPLVGLVQQFAEVSQLFQLLQASDVSVHHV